MEVEHRLAFDDPVERDHFGVQFFRNGWRNIGAGIDHKFYTVHSNNLIFYIFLLFSPSYHGTAENTIEKNGRFTK